MLLPTVQKPDLGARQQRSALVDLIERVRAEHQRLSATVYQSLCDREQPLSGTGYGEYFRLRVDGREGKAPAQPAADGFAKFGQTARCGVAR